MFILVKKKRYVENLDEEEEKLKEYFKKLGNEFIQSQIDLAIKNIEIIKENEIYQNFYGYLIANLKFVFIEENRMENIIVDEEILKITSLIIEFEKNLQNFICIPDKIMDYNYAKELECEINDIDSNENLRKISLISENF